MKDRIKDLIEDSKRIYMEAMQKYNPAKTLALYSGGNDSTTMVHVLKEITKDFEVGHCNTGTGIKDTLDFVRKTCKDNDWTLHEELPPTMSYEDTVMKYGFPGGGQHSRMYSILKERALRIMQRKLKKGHKRDIMLITGARKEESVRRMGNVKEIERRGKQVWVNLIANWTKKDCSDYRDYFEIQENDVSKKLCMSGECLCGAFAKDNELKEIEYWYPEKAKEIRDLEKAVKAKGFTWGWEQQPPSNIADYIAIMDKIYPGYKAEYLKKQEAKRVKTGVPELFDLPLCVSCEYKNDLLNED